MKSRIIFAIAAICCLWYLRRTRAIKGGRRYWQASQDDSDKFRRELEAES